MLSRRARIGLSVLAVCAGLGVLLVIAVWHLKSTYWKVARVTGDPIPVQLETVKVGTVSEVLSSEGQAREFEIVPLSALVAGTVAKIGPRVGDLVKQGERVVELDQVPLRSALNMAETQLASEKEQLAILAEKAAVLQSLFDSKFVARDELNTALLAKLNSEETLAQRLDSVVQAKVNLASALINSPVSGIVTVRDTYVGSVVKAQTPILTVAQLEPVLIHAAFAENRIRSISTGQTARVTLYAYPGEKFAGQVRWINPTVDSSTRLMTVQIMLRNPELRVKPGMRGITWLENTRSQALRVPSIAVLSTHEDTAFVFVVDGDNVAHLRKIKIGAYAEGYLEVKEGLQDGERVVVVGQIGMKDKDKVRVYER